MIPEAAVEAAIDALDDASYNATSWESMTLALEAAAPHLLADALAATWGAGFAACDRQWLARQEVASVQASCINPYVDPRG